MCNKHIPCSEIFSVFKFILTYKFEKYLAHCNVHTYSMYYKRVYIYEKHIF